MKTNVALLSALIYTTASVALAGSFFLATLLGNYDWVTRLGGAAWVFLLSMIIFMPLVTQSVKRRYAS